YSRVLIHKDENDGTTGVRHAGIIPGILRQYLKEGFFHHIIYGLVWVHITSVKNTTPLDQRIIKK
ncbi:MAG: hypothetical protein WBG62_20165, partial [Cyclobacteriaceae bacterium]